MDEQITKKIFEYLQSTESFILEHAPDVIQEALRYEKISHWAGAITTAFLTIALISAAFYFWKNPKLDKYGARELVSVFGVFVPCCSCIGTIGAMVCSIDKLIKIYFAPKYFLIQLFMGMKK